MQIKELASLLAKREGKKSQAKVGDVREILHALVVIEAECVAGGDANPPSKLISDRAAKLKPRKAVRK